MSEERVVERRILVEQGMTPEQMWQAIVTNAVSIPWNGTEQGWRIVAERVEEEPSASERLARDIERTIRNLESGFSLDKEISLSRLHDAARRLRETDPEKGK